VFVRETKAPRAEARRRRHGLGDLDAALAGLQKALEDRCREIVLLKVVPRLDQLRSGPQFEGIHRQVGLKEAEK